MPGLQDVTLPGWCELDAEVGITRPRLCLLGRRPRPSRQRSRGGSLGGFSVLWSCSPLLGLLFGGLSSDYGVPGDSALPEEEPLLFYHPVLQGNDGRFFQAGGVEEGSYLGGWRVVEW